MGLTYEELLKQGATPGDSSAPGRRYTFEELKAAGATPGVPVTTEGPPPPAPDPEPGLLNKAVGNTRAALHGATYGVGDEIAGALGSIPGIGKYLDKPLWGEGSEGPAVDRTYVQSRDQNRALQETAVNRHPVAAVAGALMSPGIGKLKGVTGIAKLAGVGGLTGLGESGADLTKGEYGQAAMDTGIGTALGGLGGAAFAGIGKLASKAKPLFGEGLAKYFGGVVDRATESVAAKKAKEAAQALRAGAGKLGGETSAGRNALATVEEILTSPNATPLQVQRAIAERTGPGAKALAQKVYDSTLDRFPDRLRAINAAEEALPQLVEANAPEAIAKAGEEHLAGWTGRIKAKWPHAINKLLPLVTGAIGGATGSGTTGALVGGGLGLGASLAMGQGGTVLKNIVRDPGLARAVGRAGLALTDNALGAAVSAAGRYSAALAQAAAESPRALLAMHEALKATYSDYPTQDVEAALKTP